MRKLNTDAPSCILARVAGGYDARECSAGRVYSSISRAVLSAGIARGKALATAISLAG